VLAAKKQSAGRGATDGERRIELEQRIKAAAGGNPGLQEVLTRRLLAGEPEAAATAVAAVEGYLATGAVPTGRASPRAAAALRSASAWRGSSAARPARRSGPQVARPAAWFRFPRSYPAAALCR
jgi:hypothetical protein